MRGVRINDEFWDAYAEKLNNYHHMINCNYETGRITLQEKCRISLQEKCKAHNNVKELFQDFFLESATII